MAKCANDAGMDCSIDGMKEAASAQKEWWRETGIGGLSEQVALSTSEGYSRRGIHRFGVLSQ